MIRIRTIGLALLAVCALGAVAVSDASATGGDPALTTGKCIKVTTAKTGWFTEAECKTESATQTGEWEWEAAPAGTTVKTASSTKQVLETASGTVVECKAESSTGKTVAGTKQITGVVVTFTGCETAIVGSCKTPGAKAGEIVTNSLEGEIGYIEPKTNHEVGLDLWPASRKGTEEQKKHEFKALFVKFECTIFVKNEVKGSVIGKLTPVNAAASTTGTITYTKGTNKGEQLFKKLEKVEGGVEDVLMSSLNSGAFEKANQQSTAAVTYGVALTLKA